MRKTLRAALLLWLPLAACGSARPIPTLSRARTLETLRVHTDCASVSSNDSFSFCAALSDDLRALGAVVVQSDSQLDIVVTRSELSGVISYLEADVRTGRTLLEHVAYDGPNTCDMGGFVSIPDSIMPCFARALANRLAQSRAVAELTPRGAQVLDSETVRTSQAPRSDYDRAADSAQQAALLTSAANPPPARTRAMLAGKLAVLDLRNFSSDIGKQSAQYFTDVVRQETLRKAPQLDVMTRENLLVLLQASGKKLEECEGECEVDTGRRIGADLIVSGVIQKIGTHYKITLRLHETKEGRLLGSAIASGKSIDELDEHAAQAADELYAMPH